MVDDMTEEEDFKLFCEVMDEAEQQAKQWKDFEGKCKVERGQIEYTPFHFLPTCSKFDRFCDERCPDYQALLNSVKKMIK